MSIIYECGAKRNNNALPYRSISTSFLERVAKAWKQGNDKFGEGNWMKGDAEFVRDVYDHAFQHLISFGSGDRSEDHLAHLVCNIQMLMTFEEHEDVQPDPDDLMVKATKEAARKRSCYKGSTTEISQEPDGTATVTMPAGSTVTPISCPPAPDDPPELVRIPVPDCISGTWTTTSISGDYDYMSLNVEYPERSTRNRITTFHRSDFDVFNSIASVLNLAQGIIKSI